jgi:succinate dehydrogenase / fumarate reductase iron-sulfur subunit
MPESTKTRSAVSIVLNIRDGDAHASFRLEAEPRRTVLDLLERLRAGGGAVPAYRHSCHHGSCGTCGAIINGLEALMCLTTVGDLATPRPRLPGGPAVEPETDVHGAVVVTLEPLARMAVVSGIAVVPGRVFAGIPSGTAYLAAVENGPRAPLPEDPEEAQGGRAAGNGSGTIEGTRKPLATAWRPTGRVRFEACIECGLCVSACPVAVPFIGPAALAAVNREREKRPETAAAMLAVAAAPDGVGPCGRHLACSRVCPQAVYPGKHIQILRNALAAAIRVTAGQSAGGGR